MVYEFIRLATAAISLPGQRAQNMYGFCLCNIIMRHCQDFCAISDHWEFRATAKSHSNWQYIAPTISWRLIDCKLTFLSTFLFNPADVFVSISFFYCVVGGVWVPLVQYSVTSMWTWMWQSDLTSTWGKCQTHYCDDAQILMSLHCLVVDQYCS